MCFVKVICIVVLLMICVDYFFQVWMYEYFGVGPQLLEDVDDIFPRFLH